MKKLYDVVWNEDTNSITIEEITVLKTDTVAGASIPTHLVNYADGSQARCSTDMYHPTKEAALTEFLQDLSNSLEWLDEEERKIAEQRKRSLEAVAIVQNLFTQHH